MQMSRMPTWLLTAVPLVATLVLAAAAAGAATFVDPTGDSGTAPDITSAQITNDARGRITFRLTLPNRTTALQPTDVVFVFMDTDRNRSTGAAEGDDHALEVTPERITVLRWDGTQYAPVTAAASTASFSAGVLRFVVRRENLGNTSAFDALLFGGDVDGRTVRAVDVAPDTGRWTYTLTRFCVVPRVVGKTLAAARATLTRAGCRVGRVTRRASTARAGRVVRQTPRAGTPLARGARVNLVLSRRRG